MKVIIDYEVPPTRAVHRFIYEVPRRINDWYEAAAQAGAVLQHRYDINLRVLTVAIQRETETRSAEECELDGMPGLGGLAGGGEAPDAD